MIFIIQRIINKLIRRNRHPRFRTARWTPPATSSRFTDDTVFTETFFANLQKTIHWTQVIIDNIGETNTIDHCRIFRATNPVYEGRPFYTFNDKTNTASVPDGFNYNVLLSEALKARPEVTLPLENIGELGKVLCFEIDVSTWDGAPAAEGGFVDEADIPPLDTWFYVTKRFLYCWIPTQFIDSMQRAIDVEILDSYAWINTTPI